MHSNLAVLALLLDLTFESIGPVHRQSFRPLSSILGVWNEPQGKSLIGRYCLISLERCGERFPAAEVGVTSEAALQALSVRLSRGQDDVLSVERHVWARLQSRAS